MTQTSAVSILLEITEQEILSRFIETALWEDPLYKTVLEKLERGGEAQ